ncbi:MAG TPA: ABC transporter permease [Candidatus Limnocylindria bacterium]|nr:ABC transporter permease [Candidatus Limnocylindria bacterium]
MSADSRADAAGVGVVPEADARLTARGEWLRRLVRNRAAAVGLVIVVLFVLIAVFADVLAPYDAGSGRLEERLLPPSGAHWLGTDALGRDMLSRLMLGARTSLEIQLATIGIAVVVGTVWGLVAGYFSGWVDDVSMRLIDVLLAFPGILLAITIVAVLGAGFGNIIIAIGIASLPGLARLVRGVVLGLRELEYVEAARAVGESHVSIMYRYVLPGTIAPLTVATSLRMASVLLSASALSFLGLGVLPPTPEWGAMLSDARDYMISAPHAAAIPGIAITVVVVGFNLLGDGLRDALDPKMRT